MSKQTSVDYLIEKVKSKEWQDLYIWQKECIFKEAKEMYQKETKKITDLIFVEKNEIEDYNTI
jgi:hypothetical protein